jgi:hypothetical protein
MEPEFVPARDLLTPHLGLAPLGHLSPGPPALQHPLPRPQAAGQEGGHEEREWQRDDTVVRLLL